MPLTNIFLNSGMTMKLDETLYPGTNNTKLLVGHPNLRSPNAQQMHLCYLGATQSVVHQQYRYSAFCPNLTFTIELQNKISTLVLRSAAVAGGDE